MSQCNVSDINLIASYSHSQVLNRTHEDLSTACESNLYTLEYLIQAGEAREAETTKGKGADDGLAEAVVSVQGPLPGHGEQRGGEKRKTKSQNSQEGGASRQKIAAR